VSGGKIFQQQVDNFPFEQKAAQIHYLWPLEKNEL